MDAALESILVRRLHLWPPFVSEGRATAQLVVWIGSTIDCRH